MKVIRKEFFELSDEDGAELRHAMKNYQNGSGKSYEVKNYGEGLLMLKPTGNAAGRCLFFFNEVVNGEEILTVVLIYKKESREAPKQVVETARRRMGNL